MTYYRQIYTKIWTDEWFLELDSNAKLLFIYLFSNSHAGVSGLYKLSRKVIAFETGLDKEYIMDTLKQFQKEEKAWYDGSVLWVKKQQVYNATRSPTMQKAIQKEMDLIADCAVKRLYCNYYLQNDTVSIPSTNSTDRVLKEREREREREREKKRKDAPSVPSSENLDEDGYPKQDITEEAFEKPKDAVAVYTSRGKST